MEASRRGAGSRLVRALWCVAHLGVSLRAFFGDRRSVREQGVLILTHEPDIDHDGQDVQMGSVARELERRGVPFFEVALVRLRKTAWRRRGELRPSPWVSWAILELVARLFSLGRPSRFERARIQVMGFLLDWVRPRSLVLIDEAGSGRALVSAARKRGIPSVGVQHGDFQEGNGQYDARAGARAEPVDLLCVWSPFFAERLLGISDTYRPEALRVTGRARPICEAPPRASGVDEEQRSRGELRLLVLGRPGLWQDFGPTLSALAAEFDLHVRSHPTVTKEPLATGVEEAKGGLADELLAADLVLGSRTSAAYEALWWRRPYLELDELPGLGKAGGAEELFDEVRSRAKGGFSRRDERERDRVWGPGCSLEENSAVAIVDAALQLAGLGASAGSRESERMADGASGA